MNSFSGIAVAQHAKSGSDATTMNNLMNSVPRKHAFYGSRIAKGMAAISLAATMIPLAAGTAHAAASVVINFAVGRTYSASINVTYSCDPGSGFTDLHGTIIASPSVSSGGALPICDGASHTTWTGGSCVIFSGCFNFTPGRYAQLYASLSSTASDSKVLILQAG